MAYTSLWSICHRLAPSALTARLNEVAASGVSSRNAVKPTRMNGRLAMSLAMSGASNPMSNQL